MTADATRLRAAITSWASSVQTVAGLEAVGLARFTGDVPIDSGELRGSFRVVRTANLGSRFLVTLAAPVIQAATTDKGARPHVIRPRRRGGLLVFSWPKAGGTVFLRSVNHPGNRPMRWWRPLVERAYGQALPLAARQVPFR